MSSTNEAIAAQLTQSLRILFEEAYAGPPDPSSTWFVSNEANCGILGTADKLTAEQASAPLGENGFSVAAHAEHLRWSLELTRARMRGEREKADWEESWMVSRVDEAQWNSLRTALRAEFDALRPLLEAGTDWSQPYVLTGTIGLIAHAAYHLGAMRQIAFRAQS